MQTKSWILVGGLAALAGCATTTSVPAGRSGLTPKEQKGLAVATLKKGVAYERFWRRPGVKVGLVKWAEERSYVVREAPPAVLEAIRDEVGRVNRNARPGEDVYVSVGVFQWRTRWFGRAPEVGVEVIGRDRAGQLLWVGTGIVRPSSDAPASLADTEETLVAREVARRLGKELGL